MTDLASDSPDKEQMDWLRQKSPAQEISDAMHRRLLSLRYLQEPIPVDRLYIISPVGLRLIVH